MLSLQHVFRDDATATLQLKAKLTFALRLLHCYFLVANAYLPIGAVVVP
jgi:hypothetical protein